VKTEVLSIFSVVGVSLVSLVGLVTVSMGEARMQRLASIFVSFAVGALLGDAFIHLIPETFSEQAPPLGRSLLILGGMMIFFVVEKLMRHRHTMLSGHISISHPELAAINVLGDTIHNFIDGVLIGASYLASPALGISTTAAVLFHEIPQEFGDFSILIHSGLTVRKAVLVNLASASVAILGTVTALAAGAFAGTRITSLLLPITAGGFVYLAAADLIPELQTDRNMRSLITQTALMTAGIALMALLTTFE
jgi:zinc and cadmium transporter